MLTDRGNMFGYQDIVVDFRNIPVMQKIGVPVIMDITHSLQQPNQEEGISGGKPEMIETIGKAAISVGLTEFSLKHILILQLQNLMEQICLSFLKWIDFLKNSLHYRNTINSFK